MPTLTATTGMGRLVLVALEELVGLKEVQRRLPDLLASLEHGRVPHFILTRRSRPVAVLLALTRYEELLATENSAEQAVARELRQVTDRIALIERERREELRTTYRKGYTAGRHAKRRGAEPDLAPERHCRGVLRERLNERESAS